MPKPMITEMRAAGEDHQVVSIKGGTESNCYRRELCPTRPWRVDAVGEFPAEAFRHSAKTAHDMSPHVFSCYESGISKPATCAGFVLQGAGHNLAVRVRRMEGSIGLDVTDQGSKLHQSYRAMAIANGVAPDDESLRLCGDRD